MSARAKATPYDEIPYLPQGSPWIHPCVLSGAAAFFGHQAAEPQTARMLDLACGRGLSLLSLAEQFPRARFTGVDLSARHVQEAQSIAREAGLGNVEFIQADLSKYRPREKFDYIGCAGTFSWVPDTVRAGILKIMESSLESHGLGAVLYAVAPGWSPLSGMREVLVYHAARYETAAEKIEQSRALFNVLHDYAPLTGQAWLQLLWAHFSSNFSPEMESNLFHEILGEIHRPFSVTEFANFVSCHGLEFLGESVGVLWPSLHVNARMRCTLPKLAYDRLSSEQYFDFFTMRDARASLVRLAGLESPRSPNGAAIDRLALVAQISHGLTTEELRKEGESVFIARQTQQFTVSDPVAKCLLAAHSKYPGQPVGFAQLLAEAEPSWQGGKKKAGKKKPAGQLAIAGRKAYVGFIASGLVTPTQPAENATPIAVTLADKPLVSRLNRTLAARGMPLISPNLTNATLTPPSRAIVLRCDGKTGRDELYRVWSEACGAEPATRHTFDTTLGKLLQAGLLVAGN